MKMSTKTNILNIRSLIPQLLKQGLIWGPIVVGVVHQFLMAFLGIDEIYVFVDPPGYIRPFVTLEYQWWFVLLFATVFMAFAAYTDRFQNVPTRIWFPLYLYMLYLLIFVKPV